MKLWKSDMRKLGPVILVIAVYGHILAADKIVASGSVAEKQRVIDSFLSGRFNWMVSPPLVAPLARPDELTYSIKDPTIVRYNEQWHLFCTIRGRKRSHQIEYLCFDTWENVTSARRYVLKLSDAYFCAPQVFFFTPHKLWYMIYQVIDPSRKPSLQPAYSSTHDLTDPNSWSKPKLLFSKQPENVKRWIDFWVICDAQRSHLFFTSLDGRMWRSEAGLSEFPGGWSQPRVVLSGDIFEASHTYSIKGRDKFLTIVEAQAEGRRYYKAYLADTLDGRWIPLAATKDKPFASPLNARHEGLHWTDSFSHGELIRDSYNERLVVDPDKLRFLFQGVTDRAKRGKKYGEIPWRLGMLRPAR